MLTWEQNVITHVIYSHMMQTSSAANSNKIGRLSMPGIEWFRRKRRKEGGYKKEKCENSPPYLLHVANFWPIDQNVGQLEAWVTFRFRSKIRDAFTRISPKSGADAAKLSCRALLWSGGDWSTNSVGSTSWPDVERWSNFLSVFCVWWCVVCRDRAV
jgi:hypothetical protein